MDWQERHVVLPDVQGIKRISYFDGGGAVKFERVGDEMLLTLSSDQKPTLDRNPVMIMQLDVSSNAAGFSSTFDVFGRIPTRYGFLCDLFNNT